MKSSSTVEAIFGDLVLVSFKGKDIREFMKSNNILSMKLIKILEGYGNKLRKMIVTMG